MSRSQVRRYLYTGPAAPRQNVASELIEKVVRADNDRVEGLLLEAMQLQDFDKLDHLVVVIHSTAPRTVASMLEPPL